MRKGYLKAKSKTEVSAFIEHSGADEVYVDVIFKDSDYGIFNLTKMIDELIEGDTIVIKSLENACNDCSQLRCILEAVHSKEVQLLILKDDKCVPLNLDSYKACKCILDFGYNKRNMPTTRNRYPENFYETYFEYSAGNLNWSTALALLGVKQGNFYALVNLFERD